jgi:Domain of unknown function (DUF6378)
MTSRRAANRRVQEFPMTAEKLLAEAAAVVRDRRHTYGQPLDLFERVAVRWSQVLGTKVTPAQVIVCLVDLKVARLLLLIPSAILLSDALFWNGPAFAASGPRSRGCRITWSQCAAEPGARTS